MVKLMVELMVELAVIISCNIASYGVMWLVGYKGYDRVPYRLLESAESDKNTLNSQFSETLVITILCY